MDTMPRTYSLIAVLTYKGVPNWHVRDAAYEGYTLCTINFGAAFPGNTTGLALLVKEHTPDEPTCSVCRSRSNLPRLGPSLVNAAGRRASTVGAFRER